VMLAEAAGTARERVTRADQMLARMRARGMVS
jgi:hypothetical protein